jgi:D-sedoheptulose 7-phosphate isomerase
MENIILKRFKESSEVKTRFLKENLPKLLDVVKLISHTFGRGTSLLFGNGSQLTLSTSLQVLWSYIMTSLPAIATMIARSHKLSNDFAFNEIFAKQVRALGKEGDVAVGISTSGHSPNVVKAFEVARELGIKTVALSGNEGGAVAKMADISLVVPSTSTPRIQEVHILIGHVLCELVEHQLFLKDVVATSGSSGR